MMHNVQLFVREVMNTPWCLGVMGFALVFVPILGMWAVHKYGWEHWEPFVKNHLTDHITSSTMSALEDKNPMEEKREKRRDALGLFYESVLKPDHELRQCAHNQKCYHELMEWRSEIIEYLDRRRNEEF